MKNQEELQDAADRAFELLEQKSPHQLAVELAVLQRKYNAAMDMLCEARTSVEFRHNTTTNFGGTVTTGRLLEKIDALLAGQVPELLMISKDRLPKLTAEEIKSLQRCGPVIRYGKQAAAEGWQRVPVEPTMAMSEAGAGITVNDGQSEVSWIGDIYRAMLAAAPTPDWGAR